MEARGKTSMEDDDFQNGGKAVASKERRSSDTDVTLRTEGLTLLVTVKSVTRLIRDASPGQIPGTPV